jgi:hypothetical protein
MLEFKPYSMYDNYTVATKGRNVSTIIDKLIRLTAKITEQYASDIVYDINSLNDALEDRRPFMRYLAFREGGVSSYTEDNIQQFDVCGEVIQWWKLSYDPTVGDYENGGYTTLIRQNMVVRPD